MSDNSKMSENNLTSVSNVADVVHLDVSNAEFFMKTDFLGLEFIDSSTGERKIYNRVSLHRAFPFDKPYEYISVLDTELQEIGIILDVSLFSEETERILRNELERKYYVRQIIEIYSIKERYGFSYWKTKTDAGDVSFTLRDTYRSIMRVTPTRLLIQDVDGNRYEIVDTSTLDKKSYKRIELYL